MIKELIIQNFQSHKDTNIKFSPGVNVILGTSDSGKSAFFRALLWLCYNRPLGDRFRSWWGGDTIVKGILGKNVITRLKTKKENSYTINDNTPLKAVRADVPPEVQNMLKIDRSINVQAQADPFFLLSNMDSPGKVAEQFNSIANLDLIDSSRKLINAMELSENAAINKLKSEVEEIEKNIKEYTWVEKAEIILSKAEKYNKKIIECEASATVINNFLIAIERTRKQIDELTPVLKLQPILNQVNEVLTEIKRLGKAKSEIESTLSKIKEQKAKLKHKKTIKDAFAELNVLSDINIKIKKENQNKKDLIGLIDSIQRAKRALMVDKQEVKKMQDKFDINMPDICPLCGK